MIDWINEISYTRFFAWLVAVVHPLIMVTAACALTGAVAHLLARRIVKAPAEDRPGRHLALCLGFPFWLLAWSYTTYACFKAHGVNDGEPIVSVMAVCVPLYFWLFIYWSNRVFAKLED